VAVSRLEWFSRHRRLVTRAAFVLLLAVVAVESLLLYLQRSVNQEIEAQSARLLGTFLERDTVETARSPGVAIRMENVRFKWSDKVFVDTADMAVRAVSNQGNRVDFDDLDSFVLLVQRSEVRIRPDVLEGMFNESVFNYPESKLRDLKVSLTESDGDRVVRVTGSARVVLWIPFEMKAHLRADTATNTLVLETNHVKALGILPVTALVKFEPFQLQHLISLPPNQSLLVDANRIMIKPFGLFPPPRINGRISKVTVEEAMIRLEFAGEPISAPKSAAKNYVYLAGGESRFGSFRMAPTNVLLLDQDPRDAFVVSLRHYADLIPRSTIEMPDVRSVRVTMPDFGKAIP
jgi:hypothetical protein